MKKFSVFFVPMWSLGLINSSFFVPSRYVTICHSIEGVLFLFPCNPAKIAISKLIPINPSD